MSSKNFASKKAVLRREVRAEDIYDKIKDNALTQALNLMKIEEEYEEVVSIEVKHDLKTFEEYDEFREMVMYYVDSGNIKRLYIITPPKCSITSHVIGFLVKVIFQYQIEIFLLVQDRSLYKILEDLSLKELFHMSFFDGEKFSDED